MRHPTVPAALRLLMVLLLAVSLATGCMGETGGGSGTEDTANTTQSDTGANDTQEPPTDSSVVDTTTAVCRFFGFH